MWRCRRIEWPKSSEAEATAEREGGTGFQTWRGRRTECRLERVPNALSMPLRGSSVVDCLDAKPLELFKVVPHVLEHLGGVWLPVQDLGNYSQWLPGAVGPRRVARELLVRQVGVILKGPVGSTR
jgi:hypothetical protein